jgi:hypothetical protein
VLSPLGNLRKVELSEYRTKWRGDSVPFSGVNNLGQFQGRKKLVVGDFENEADRRGNKRYFLREEAVNAFHDSMIMWLRHETPGKTDVPHRPFHVDELGRVSLEELVTLFFHEFKDAIDDGLHLELGAWLVIHIMAWFPSKYIFWCNKSDWNSNCVLTRVPQFVSAVTGHTRALDRNKITERMSCEATDEFPNVLHHGTTWNNLEGIRKAGGLIPGGTRLLKRPIFAETYVLEKGVTGDGHRPESEVSISINPVKLAKACDKDDNRLSISIGNVAQIEGTVAIAKLIRIEVFADGSDLTLWNHPGTNTINWFRCKGEGCGIYVGINIACTPQMTKAFKTVFVTSAGAEITSRSACCMKSSEEQSLRPRPYGKLMPQHPQVMRMTRLLNMSGR